MSRRTFDAAFALKRERATEYSKVGKHIGFIGWLSQCPCARWKISEIVFFPSLPFLRPKKGGKNHRGFPSNVAPGPYEQEREREKETERVREEDSEMVGSERARRVRLHRAFPFPGYPSIPLSAVLVTQSKLSPSKLHLSCSRRSGEVPRIRITRFQYTL